MKRIILSFIILLAAQIGFAQEEVAIEQNINASIGCLNINAGWDVRLMHRETEGYRLAVVVPERFASIATETQVCNLKGDTLTILKNTMLPQGTIVELEGNLNFRFLVIYQEAKVAIDRLSVPDNATTKYDLYLGNNSKVSINRLISNGEPYINLGDKSKLCIDTIQGNGKPLIEIYNADFQYGTNLLDGEILVKEYERKLPNGFYKPKNPKIIKTKIVDGHPVTKERYKIWNADFTCDASIGYRRNQNPKDFESPFTNNGISSLSFGLSTSFRLGDYWTLTTGLRYNDNEYFMSHQVKLTEGRLEAIDGQTPIQQNRLFNCYLGIPIVLCFGSAELFGSGELLNSNLSLDLFFGHILFGVLRTRNAEDNYKKWHSEKATSIFNPWKLEVGLSFNTNLIGFIHGIRVYTNLLPEYNKAVTTEKFRSIGVEIKL